jgi:hypothetical protein
MRSRFALLIAAAVVFTPGWHGRPSQHPRTSDLVARVLAPTGDEGVMRHPAPSVKHQLGGRQTKRWRPGFTSETTATFSFGALTIVILWTLASYWGPMFGLHRFRFRFSRAPPRPS